MLLHGADPDAGNLVYAQNEAVHQLLPALYYTTAVECSIPKTAALLKFGASLKAKVDTGIGWRHEFALDDYLCEVYPGANRLLWQAYNSVAYGSFRAIRNAYVPGPKQKLKKDEAVKSEENSDPSSPSVQTKSDKKPVADEVKKTETPEDEYSVIRRLAKQLIDFDYSNGSRFLYLDALRKPEHTSLAFLIIGIITGVLFFADLLFFDTFSVLFFIPMVAMLGIYIFAVAKRKKSAKERRAEADRILAQRRQMIGNLNRLSQGKDITPWWSSANGFVIASKKLYRLLVWTPFDRVYHNTANNGLAMKGLCTESDAITGASVMKMLKSDDYRVLINSGIKAENNYKIAELCLWTLIDGTHVYREGMSESEIKSDMAMYNARQDEKERIRNFYEHNCIGMTDEDRYWFSDMSYTDLSRSQFWRQIRTEEYEKKLRNVSYTVIQDKDKYNHFLEPVGVIIFDNADNIVGVLVYRKNFQIERYETDGNKMIYGTTIKSNKFKLDELDMEVIRNLRNYPVAMPDLASRKPETFTDVEWAEFVYACVHEGKILNAIRAEYAEVYEKKRMNIAANSSLLR